MGANRACEMRHLGVRGFGQIYEWFCRDENFRDDEVALTHQSSPPYAALSEPLIHIRLWLRELRRTNLLTSRQEKRLLDELMSMWFGERTLPGCAQWYWILLRGTGIKCTKPWLTLTGSA